MAAAAILVVLSAVGSWGLWTFRHDVVVAIMLAGSAIVGATAFGVVRHGALLQAAMGRRKLLLLVMGTATLMRLVLLPAPPLSTDIYRYIWDGRVQAAGINPYRYIPDDPALTALRDKTIWPSINRAATAHTIYPPAAQVVFLAASRIAETVPV
ncbi:MAG TPA: hypothetical protein VL574_05750, partial [Stellaceae bacterium]|nr:hypothetical protein [Stellaceae bacterium]